MDTPRWQIIRWESHHISSVGSGISRTHAKKITRTKPIATMKNYPACTRRPNPPAHFPQKKADWVSFFAATPLKDWVVWQQKKSLRYGVQLMKRIGSSGVNREGRRPRPFCSISARNLCCASSELELFAGLHFNNHQCTQTDKEYCHLEGRSIVKSHSTGGHNEKHKTLAKD